MADKFPGTANVGLTQTDTLDWSPDSGEVKEQSLSGPIGDLTTLYSNLKSSPPADLANLVISNQRGRGTLIARFVRDTKVIEEVYAIDVIRDMETNSFFDALTDSDVAEVRLAVDSRLTDAEISGYAAWAVLKKQLRFILLHGEQSYFETGFIYRKTTAAMKTSSVSAAFTNINRVVTAPTVSGALSSLLASLPTGEWLKKPPQAEYLGRGKWRVTEELHWAKRWSVVYGGTFGATTTT